MKKKICFLLSTLLCILSFLNLPVFAQGYSRTITGSFTNMDVFLNDIPVNLSQEPFFYEGEIYLPLKNLARQMYFSANYDETAQKITIDSNGVLNNTGSQNFYIDALQKDYSIFSLSKEIEGLGGQASQKLPTDIDTLSDMTAYLENRFGYLEGIPVTFDFRDPRDNEYLLYISFSPNDRTSFENLSRGSIEYWLEDVFYSIMDLYDFSAEIQGFIRAGAPSYRTYVTFETERDSFSFNFSSDNEASTGPIQIDRRSLEERLGRNLPSYSSIDFDYSATVNRYDVNLIVYFTDRDFYDWGSTRIKNYLERLRREIHSFEEDLYVYGTIIDDRVDEDIVYFILDDDGTITFHNNLSTINPPSLRNQETKPSTPEKIVLSRDMKVWFLYPQLVVDDRSFSMLKEVFLAGEEIYIALSDLGDALYWAFDYNPENNQLHIIDNSYYSHQNPFLEASLLFEKNVESERLAEDLSYMKEQIERQSSLPSSYKRIETVGRMESYLKDYFEDFEGIDTNIQFTLTGEHNYRIRITYPQNEYHNFENIRRNIIEGWIEEMFFAIKELYDPYAKISGSIRSTPYDEDTFTYITFDFDTDDWRLSFDFEDHGNQSTSYRNIDLQKLERALDKNLWRFTGVSFKYEVVRNRSDIDINVYFSDSRFYDWDAFDKIDYLQELLEEIEDVYDNLTINGRIIDEHSNKTALDFSIKNGEIRSYELIRDLEDYLDRNYRSFKKDGNTFNFTYKIYERTADSFEVKLEGDFFQEASAWRSIAEDDDALQHFKEEFVETSLEMLANLFNAKVSGEVVDKSYRSLLITSVP